MVRMRLCRLVFSVLLCRVPPPVSAAVYAQLWGTPPECC